MLVTGFSNLTRRHWVDLLVQGAFHNFFFVLFRQWKGERNNFGLHKISTVVGDLLLAPSCTSYSRLLERSLSLQSCRWWLLNWNAQFVDFVHLNGKLIAHLHDWGIYGWNWICRVNDAVTLMMFDLMAIISADWPHLTAFWLVLLSSRPPGGTWVAKSFCLCGFVAASGSPDEPRKL